MRVGKGYRKSSGARVRLMWILCALAAWPVGLCAAAPVGTAFTYQGRLKDRGSATNGDYDFRFSLYDALTDGHQVGSTISVDRVSVTNGLFAVQLDFGNNFRGSALWLEIEVAPSGSGSYVVLSPRQELTPTPYALYAVTAESVTGGITGNGSANYVAKFTATRTMGNSTIFDNGARVGIGTAAPAERLSVNGIIESMTGGFKFPDGTVQSTAFSGEASPWQQDGSKIYYNGGAVGIGTSNPDGLLAVEKHADNNIQPMVVFRTTGVNSAGAIRFENADGNEFNLGITKNNELALGYNANISLASDLLRITSAGNVGIGTLSPGAKLDVNGTVKMTGFQLGTSATAGHVLTADSSGVGTWQPVGSTCRWQENATEIYYDAGNVGIGVNNPLTTLHVAGGKDILPGPGDFYIGDPSVYGIKMGVDLDGVGAGQCRITTSGIGSKLILGAYGGNDALAIKTGKVGINNTDPTVDLDVNGTVKMTGFHLTASPGAGYILTSDAAGQGTWQPPPSGMSLPFDGTVSHTGAAFSVTNSGTSIGSHGIKARISNASSHNNAAAGYFDATGTNGMALYAIADGEYVIRSQQNGPTGTAISASSAGSGAASFSCSTADGYAVKGHATATSGSDTIGGWFESNANGGKAVKAVATGDAAAGVLVQADGTLSVAVHATAGGTQGWAVYANNNSTNPTIEARNYGTGDILVGKAGTDTVFRVDSDGTTYVDVLTITGGADLAERFDVGAGAKPGMVVEIDPDRPGKLRVARGAYNRRVAGVVSGAGGVEAGMILADLPGDEGSRPVALSGRVWVYCDATERAIEPGDLLTTSATPGHAMAVDDYQRANGATLGKAMTALPKGKTGMVLVLVNLQ